MLGKISHIHTHLILLAHSDYSWASAGLLISAIEPSRHFVQLHAPANYELQKATHTHMVTTRAALLHADMPPLCLIHAHAQQSGAFQRLATKSNQITATRRWWPEVRHGASHTREESQSLSEVFQPGSWIWSQPCTSSTSGPVVPTVPTMPTIRRSHRAPACLAVAHHSGQVTG